jgi:UDP-GlcNAc:undecaprenyl-phosphate GlcNAc-1-phosphate transferase
VLSHPNIVLGGEVLGLLISATIVFITGLVDDVKSIRPTTKLMGQLIAALVFVGFGGYVKFLSNPFGGDIIFLDYFGVPVTVLWLMGISNAVNLIDGLDGLAAGVSIISACTMAVVSLSHGYFMPAALLFVLASATLGFLRFNFSPASIFMGDSGSLTLGFVLGAIAIMGFAKGATIVALVIPVLILAIPIFDTFFAIVRRLIEHKPIMQPDKGHLHHRLLAMGLSHKQTVLIIYAITMFMGCIAILTALLPVWATTLLLVLALAILFCGAHHLGILKIGGSDKK